ncbi:GGDEF domain-containing protein [Faecalicatena sp. AGMB00832]|uniref:GGDEF domain-containing protein n=1 Tax=Faecalicatena faecalis TaxID=2726362 RepID=A0ABS6D4R3_9FIRM|nr:GGDEF domain-containing protein [Faecalicatena faecalis]MBU3876574.1 GGDEF domain-containing protein [Faecalicatena faecalis]
MISYNKFFIDNYHTYYKDIADKNLKAVQLISALGVIIGLPLSILSLFVEQFLKATEAYILLVVTSIILYLLSKTFLKTHKRLVPLAIYIVFAIIMATAIYMGTVTQPMMNAVTFFVFLVILPLFMIDIPIRMCIFMGFFCLIFCLTSRYVKIPYLASYDIVNAVIFYLLSIITSHQSNYLNLKQIMSNNILEIQRDTDKMTGLWNRGFCERKINTFLATQDSKGALLVVDVDNFKLVNDSNGHACGDKVLREVGAALKDSFRNSDIIGRLGGDEFLIFLPNCIDSEIIRHRVSHFLDIVNKIDTTSDEEIPHISASVGVSLFPEDGDNFKDLYKHADEALYLSKQSGKNQYAFYHLLA